MLSPFTNVTVPRTTPTMVSGMFSDIKITNRRNTLRAGPGYSLVSEITDVSRVAICGSRFLLFSQAKGYSQRHHEDYVDLYIYLMLC